MWGSLASRATPFARPQEARVVDASTERLKSASVNIKMTSASLDAVRIALSSVLETSEAARQSATWDKTLESDLEDLIEEKFWGLMATELQQWGTIVVAHVQGGALAKTAMKHDKYRENLDAWVTKAKEMKQVDFSKAGPSVFVKSKLLQKSMDVCLAWANNIFVCADGDPDAIKNISETDMKDACSLDALERAVANFDTKCIKDPARG